MKFATIVLLAAVGLVAFLSVATAEPEPEDVAAVAPAVEPKKFGKLTDAEVEKLSKMSKEEKRLFFAERRVARKAFEDAKMAKMSETEKAAFMEKLAERDAKRQSKSAALRAQRKAARQAAKDAKKALKKKETQ